MYPFRDKTPKHRTGRRVCVNYAQYKVTLRADFNNCCGYCNDHDSNSKRSYVIDHFVPQNPDGFTHSIKPNRYRNLIYSCSFCNGQKSNKWPTNDARNPNNGTDGFIIPTEKAYGDLFERDVNGYIIVKNNSAIGKYIFKELNLGWVLHSLNWKFEKLLSQEKTLKQIYDRSNDPAVKKTIDDLRSLRLSVVDNINELFQ
ncbi:MAG: HNH endonuclease signature motif containing protein [Bacteroidia bacterium]